jgi:hypothetical protein
MARVDASLNKNGSGAIGNPMFFEDNWGAPVLSFAFENSSIVDVTSTYRSDGFSPSSLYSIALMFVVFLIPSIVIIKFLILPIKSTPQMTAEST